jgi:hypothetical protein
MAIERIDPTQRDHPTRPRHQHPPNPNKFSITPCSVLIGATLWWFDTGSLTNGSITIKTNTAVTSSFFFAIQIKVITA